jgi:uncharacterized protein (TIGR02266 family)
MSLGAIDVDRIDWTRQEPLRHGRVGVEIAVELDGHGDGRAGITRNVSAAGAFVATRAELRVGELVTLRLAIPGYSVAIPVRAEVRWVRPSAETAGRSAGAGLRFVEPSIAASASIAALLQGAVTGPPRAR